jgi:hypothetical protein
VAYPEVHISRETQHLCIQEQIKDYNILINKYLTLQRAAAEHKKIGRKTPYKHSKLKLIYNDVLKSTKDNSCSIIDPLHTEKYCLPPEHPVMSKLVVDIF